MTAYESLYYIIEVELDYQRQYLFAIGTLLQQNKYRPTCNQASDSKPRALS